jgi:hypothetical protein
MVIILQLLHTNSEISRTMIRPLVSILFLFVIIVAFGQVEDEILQEPIIEPSIIRAAPL